MTAAYQNFKLALYCPAPDLLHITEQQLEKDLAFFQNHLKLSKVYLESHRGDISLEKADLLHLKAFFESRGIEVSGGITPTLPDTYRAGYGRLFGGICYTDERSRAKFQAEVEKAASVFDEVIFDDFFFNNCACDSCLEQKGDRSWAEFRLERMTEVSENLVMKAARRVNPRSRMIIKYPNWIESYQGTGYNTLTQPGLFDGVYTGTETRDPETSQQHIPRYASYSLLRWMEHLKPGQNGGGWFDNLDCSFLDHYLEQAYLTVFGKARELTLFCYGLLRDSVHVPPLGFQLEKLDHIAAELGGPLGVWAYHPHQGKGEDHLYNYLGMAGIPIEPTPHFPEQAACVLVTATSAQDSGVLQKIQTLLKNGGNVVMTSGFLERMQGRGIESMTTLTPTGKKLEVQAYGKDTHSCTFRTFQNGDHRVLFPVLDYCTNGTWQVIAGFNGENNISLLMYDNYSRGKLYTLTVPDHIAELPKLPPLVLGALREVLGQGLPVQLDGPGDVGLFCYDSGVFVLESFARRPESWRVRVPGGETLTDLLSGSMLHAQGMEGDVAVFEVRLPPSRFQAFRIGWKS
ncbi:permease [Deinococcus cellulosilyticus]|uniref:Permease n=1 Tax=Deinococcus cellulosilyticus (strain DSM 18568 / NBRC 106333 / KACC 11606 / 5516J-15) TaxID=1223518 RepID=A0A511MVC0_DEIC1|nr:permease [Deinococcus cellulosilyticus]GEM44520.1 permease [Deinococcus cellulosilyticus NBRC 106333 = KACC 11606]